MKKMMAGIRLMWLMVGALAPLFLGGMVFAAGDCDVETSILPGNWGISDILNLVLNIIVYGLGVAAVLGVIIAGVMYMTARDNEAQVTRAKTRLYEVVIGLIAWALMYVVLRWLIPGGLDFNIPNECSAASAVVEAVA